jgi:hypothetical protein
MQIRGFAADGMGVSATPSWSEPALPPLTPTLVTQPPISPAPASEPAPPVVPFAAPAPAPEPEPAPPVLPPAAAEPPPVAPPVLPAPAPVPDFVAPEPVALAATTYRILIRVDTGEQIEVAAHAEATAARSEATTLMRYLRDGRGDWPFVGGRFIRPDRIVSVDVEETRF